MKSPCSAFFMRIFILLAIYGLILVQPVLAAGDPMIDRLNNVATGAGLTEVDNDPDLIQHEIGEYIGTVIGALLTFIGVLFILLAIYAGYLWMTSSGNEQQVDRAKRIITASIIGVFIVAMAYAITRFVSTLITDAGLFQ